jgi:hypothetical protein
VAAPDGRVKRWLQKMSLADGDRQAEAAKVDVPTG